jgi:hypothetical protein
MFTWTPFAEFGATELGLREGVAGAGCAAALACEVAVGRQAAHAST